MELPEEPVAMTIGLLTPFPPGPQEYLKYQDHPTTLYYQLQELPKKGHKALNRGTLGGPWPGIMGCSFSSVEELS